MINVDDTLLEGYKFIDLFAGIGGFHLALTSYGAECVFASEWDKYAAGVYQKNFGITPAGDITQIKAEEIPAHDILCAGFPCQAFSISGKRKGFEDTRGTLFFDIARVVNYHTPKVLLLENVKNIVKHNNGETLKTITGTLKKMGYSVFYDVLNSSHFGLPQNRERLYLVAFHNKLNVDLFQFPKPVNTPIYLEQILETNPAGAKVIERDDIEIYTKYAAAPNSFFNDFKPVNRPIQIGKVNKGGQGERIYHPSGHAITLSAYGGGVGAKTGLYLINGKIRKLSPRECARIQGFPEDFSTDNSTVQAYKQFGNSVSIDVLQYILKKVAKSLRRETFLRNEGLKFKYA